MSLRTDLSRRWPLALSACVLAGCVATVPRAGQSLPGVSLVAQGQDITLSWQPDSLIVRALRPMSTVEVVGEYPTADGRVTGDPVGVARMSPGATQLRFTLAESLRGVPTGPVCLRLRVDGRSALPLRAADGGSSTDGFHYAAWSQAVSGGSRRRALEQERAMLETSGSTDRDALAAFEGWRRTRGLNEVADCGRLGVASTSARPATALDPGQWEPAARRECTWRLQSLLKLIGFKDTLAFVDTAEATYQRVQAEFRAKGVASNASGMIAISDTLQRLRGLRAVVQPNIPQVGPPYRPSLLDEPLSVTSTTEQLLVSYIKAGKAFPVDAMPGLIDAFESCQLDAVSQFRLSSETWRREQDPRLQAGRVEAVRGECRARFADAQRRADRTSQRQARLQQINTELVRPPGTEANLPRGLSLIDTPCGVSP